MNPTPQSGMTGEDIASDRDDINQAMRNFMIELAQKETPMLNEFRAQMALECLRLAHIEGHPHEDVVTRATAYLGFVLGEQSPREQVIAAMDKAGVR